MEPFDVELLGPGTTLSFHTHAYKYIQLFHAQKKALTVLLENEHICELSYQGTDGKTKNVDDLLYARLNALEQSMENERENTRVIKTYQCMLENILKNFSLGESIRILQPVVERYLETSSSQYVANTQELQEFNLCIDELHSVIVRVTSILRDTKDLLSGASLSAQVVDLGREIWDALCAIVAAFGLQYDGQAEEAMKKAAAKLLHVTQYKLTSMLNRLREPACNREVRQTIQAYHDRLATIQERLLELDSVMFSSTQRGAAAGLPVQRLWETVLERLGILASFEPEYQLTEEEVNVVTAFWFETTRAVDQVLDARNHGAVFNEVTTTLETQFNALLTADHAWDDQDQSDIGIDTDQYTYDTDTDDLGQGWADEDSAWTWNDASTPSSNSQELPRLIITPTEDVDELIDTPEDLTTETAEMASSVDQPGNGPVNVAQSMSFVHQPGNDRVELCERLIIFSKSNRAMHHSTQRILHECITVRQKFCQVLALPNLDKLTVNNNVWLRPAHDSDAQAQSGAEDPTGGRLCLKDVVEHCWQEYVVLEDECRTFMNDLKIYADGQLILLPAVLALGPHQAITVTAYIGESWRRIERLKEKSAAVAKQHREIHERWEKCLVSIQEQFKKEEADIKKLLQDKVSLDSTLFKSTLATLTSFGAAWYFWAHLGLTVVGPLAGVAAVGVTVYSIRENWDYKSTRKAILDQIEKDTAVINKLTEILSPMRNLEESLKDLNNLHHTLHYQNLADVTAHMETKSLDILRVMQPKIYEKLGEIRELCDRYVEITGKTLDLNPADTT